MNDNTQNNVNGANIMLNADVINVDVNGRISDLDLVDQAAEILRSLSYREFETAEHQLSVIRNLNTLNQSAQHLIKILSGVHSQISPSAGGKSYFTEAIKYQRSAPSDDLKDIAISLLIRVEAERNPKGHEDAIKRVQSCDQLGQYSSEAYFELVALPETCCTAWEDDRHDLTETELTGLVRGLIRNNQLEQCEAASFLSDIYPSNNASILELIAKTQAWETSCNQQHYWQLTPEQYQQALDLADEWVATFENVRPLDRRVIQISTNLLQFLMGEHKGLQDLCYKHIDEVTRYAPFIADNLRLIFQTQPDFQDAVFAKYRRFDTDLQYREQEITRIVSKQELDETEAALLRQFGNKDQIRQWHEQGSKLKAKSPLVKAVQALELAVQMADETPDRQDLVRQRCRELIELQDSKMHYSMPEVVQPLADRLLSLGLPDTAVHLLIPSIPTAGKLWSSPLITSYLQALLYARQIKTLGEALDRIEESDRSGYVWYLAGKGLLMQEKYELAAGAFESAVLQAPSVAAFWAEFAAAKAKAGSSHEELSEVADRFPDELLDLSTHDGLWLMQFSMLHGFTNKMASHALSQFVDAPEQLFIPFSNIWMTLIVSSTDFDPDVVETNNVLGAVVYSLHGKTNLQLIVRNPPASQWLINAESPLAKQLLAMEPGEESQYNFSPLLLHSKPNPFILASRLASEHRSISQIDGDCFLLLQTANDPDAMIKQLQEVVAYYQSPNNELYSRSDIPLIFKFGIQDLSLQSSLQLQLDPAVHRDGLPSFGEVEVGAAICDLHTLVYLAITGLFRARPFSNIKLNITTVTHDALVNGLRSISEDQALRVQMLGGQLIKLDAEEYRQLISSYVEGLQELSKVCTVISPETADMPLDMAGLVDSIDESVLSSMTAAFTKQIPLMTIDPVAANLMCHAGGISVNMYELALMHSENASQEQRHQAINASIAHKVPVAIVENDMLDLGRSGDEADLQLLIELLQVYSERIVTMSGGMLFLLRIMASAMLGARHSRPKKHQWFLLYSKGTLGCIEQLFHIVCCLVIKTPDGKSSEERLARFTHDLWMIFPGKHNERYLYVLSQYAETFLRGHFMDRDYFVEQLWALFYGEEGAEPEG